ncbi:uncharacterized protein YALI1_D30526g [Yarrowia lipolytica]|uniref:Uncharacterized protein n=1 Tax=Yarrowia lipolytica TaxID=4952 RepID=A0A1D8NFZ9_YARLL|nr:hypothetical protein YALI1_D30526g [Yarrowia lipolytica]
MTSVKATLLSDSTLARLPQLPVREIFQGQFGSNFLVRMVLVGRSQPSATLLRVTLPIHLPLYLSKKPSIKHLLNSPLT